MGHAPRLANSKSVIPRGLSIFPPPATNPCIVYTTEKEYFNKGDNLRGSKIRFVITPSSTEYIDLRQCTLFVKCQITKVDPAYEDGVPLGPTDFCAPINNSLNSLFSQVDVQFNDKVMNDFTPNHPYASYLKVLTNYGSDAQKGYLQCGFYVPDDVGKVDENDADPRTSGNESLGRRSQWSKNKKITMIGPLDCDVFGMERYLVNGVGIQINLTQSSDSFRLICSPVPPPIPPLEGGGDGEGYVATKTENVLQTQYQLRILDARLRMRLLSLHPTSILGIEATLSSGFSAIYPYMRSAFRTRTWSKELSSGTLDDIFQGAIPNKLIMVLVTNRDFTGNIHTNPFNFQHFDIRSVGLSLNSCLFNGRQLLIDPSEGDYTEVLSYVHQNINRWNKDKGIVLGRDDWPSGKALFCFNLEGLGSTSTYPVLEQGNLSVSLSFGSGGPQTSVTAVFFGEFRSLFGIDIARNVIDVSKAKLGHEF